MTWRGLSVFGLMLILLGLMMLAPAIFAASLGDGVGARAFLLSGLISGVAGGLLTLAQFGVVIRSEAVGEFGTLLAAMLIAPLFAATPVAILAPFLSFEAAYFEMVSCITTTGATVLDRPENVNPAINLWRAMTAWFGGLIILVAAFAILAPRNLGGFEVRGEYGRSGAVGRLQGQPEWAGGGGREAAADRVAEAIRMILPIYAGLSLGLGLLLMISGMAPLNAAVAAMGVLSTSGVKATSAPAFENAGHLGEAVAAVFLVLAATRRTYGAAGQGALNPRLLAADAELRILFVIVFAAAGWLYLRHFIAALELDERTVVSPEAFWGAFFTVISFATTTGYESASWGAARAWSGLSNASLILFGLVIIGGGVATTAGGIKLLRAYALFNHGRREMERLVRPSSVSGSGARKRGLRREGAQIAWVFVMLFLVSMASAMLALSLTGLEFETSLAASIAAFSNAGPVFTSVNAESSWLTTLTPEARGVIVVAMVLGRVELLVLIAMINPDNWR